MSKITGFKILVPANYRQGKRCIWYKVKSFSELLKMEFFDISSNKGYKYIYFSLLYKKIILNNNVGQFEASKFKYINFHRFHNILNKFLKLKNTKN